MDPIIPIGKPAPHFQLPDIEGKDHALDDMVGWIVVLNFWSAECDWCERVDHELTAYLEAWKDKVRVWWIASNANEAPEQVRKVAAERKLATVLVDDHQEVAKLYGAQTTPHFFIVDTQGRLAYQGAWDDITFRQRVASQVYVPKVIASLQNSLTPEISQTPPYGCVLVRSFE